MSSSQRTWTPQLAHAAWRALPALRRAPLKGVCILRASRADPVARNGGIAELAIMARRRARLWTSLVGWQEGDDTTRVLEFPQIGRMQASESHIAEKLLSLSCPRLSVAMSTQEAATGSYRSTRAPMQRGAILRDVL